MIKILQDLYSNLIKEYDSKFIESNALLNYHSKEDYLTRQIKAHELLTSYYKKLNNVALVYTSDPICFCHFLKDSNLTIISDHPLLERTKDFYTYNFNAKINLINPLFESFNCNEFDLLIYPEYEFYVPFDLINNFNYNKDIAVFYSIDKGRYTPGHNLALCIEDIEEMCNFTKEYSFGKYQLTSNVVSYYGFGNR